MASTVGRSQAAAVVRSWPTLLKRRLGIDPALVAMLDFLVTICAIGVDDTDPRPWYERLDSDLELVADELFAGIDVNEVVKRLESIATPAGAEIGSWVKKFGGKGAAARWLMRAVGSGRYYRARKAFKADAAVVVVAARRGLRWFLPYTVALDDCASVLTANQVTAIYKACGQTGSNASIASFLNIVVTLDRQIDRLLDHGVPVPQATARSEERTGLDVPDVEAFAAELRLVVKSQSQSMVIELSQALANKIQGARDALEYSADPVSQAANSLIELIDRLLREAFTDAEVIEWADANLPSEDLTFVDPKSGRRRPTKRGQALCFVYAGQKIQQQRSVINELGAAGLVATRDRLQQLKHADRGTPEDRATLMGLLSAVEAYLVVSFRLGWSVHASAEDLERLRARFVPAA